MLFTDVIDRTASDAFVAHAGSLRPRHLPARRHAARSRAGAARHHPPRHDGDAAFQRAAAEELLEAREGALAELRSHGVLVLDVLPDRAARAWSSSTNGSSGGRWSEPLTYQPSLLYHFPMKTAADPTLAADTFRVLSDPTRLLILERLRGGERCVCELMDLLDAAQSRLSFHLRVLKDAGMVTDRRDGRWVHYTLVPGALEEAAAFLTHLAPEQALPIAPTEGSCCR